MAKASSKSKAQRGQYSLPIIVEQDEDGVYVVECPILSGCYTQGDTLDEALRNIEEVIDLIKDEDDSKEILRDYKPQKVSFHTISITI
jgi:predicted RNase H-like HicB family nuclease